MGVVCSLTYSSTDEYRSAGNETVFYLAIIKFFYNLFMLNTEAEISICHAYGSDLGKINIIVCLNILFLLTSIYKN